MTSSFSPQAKKKPEQSGLCSGVVREMGVEPTLQRNWFLRPARLPFRHSRIFSFPLFLLGEGLPEAEHYA